MMIGVRYDNGKSHVALVQADMPWSDVARVVKEDFPPIRTVLVSVPLGKKVVAERTETEPEAA